jgi:hypothetical protein
LMSLLKEGEVVMKSRCLKAGRFDEKIAGKVELAPSSASATFHLAKKSDPRCGETDENHLNSMICRGSGRTQRLSRDHSRRSSCVVRREALAGQEERPDPRGWSPQQESMF